MSNVLLVEPNYRSKFPPLGLMRISTYHKHRGDCVTFVRGRDYEKREMHWHRIYISTLFTWELPRAVKTIEYYRSSVSDSHNIVVGGIGATLMPEYIKGRVSCKVIRGRLDRKGKLGPGSPSLDRYMPDYSIVDSPEWKYKPEDSYFCRTTKGCVRKCKFCAVGSLEPRFSQVRDWRRHIGEVRTSFGERQHIVFLDNNVVAAPNLARIVNSIRDEGFERGAVRNGRKRAVDFNQGIDARLITRKIAKCLSGINLSPIRLAFDYDAIEPHYRKAVRYLVDEGFRHFTNYVMFNFNDTPRSLYRRLKINLQLSRELGVAITGFPMRFIPINDVTRQYVSKRWRWRYLRGIQCILLATRGMVSPNPEFFAGAFGNSYKEFLEIISMPDRYIIQRKRYANDGAADWCKRYTNLSQSSKNELLGILADLNGSRNKKADMAKHKKFRVLLEHYYPDGRVLRE